MSLDTNTIFILDMVVGSASGYAPYAACYICTQSTQGTGITTDPTFGL